MVKTSSRRSATLPTGRYNFARLAEVLDVPYLLETMKKSYDEFLQAHVPPSERKDVGLQEAFKSIFPIKAANSESTLEFVEYTVGRPKYTEQECLERGMTYSAPVQAKLQLIVREVNEQTGEVDVRDIREQMTYIGDIPLMTDRGTFIINGAERVIVSQLHRSPGVSFGSTVHSNGKTLYEARVIPNYGAWIEFKVDINDVMYVEVDRKRKMLATTFLKCFGLCDNNEIARRFFNLTTVPLDDFSKGAVPVTDLAEKYLGAHFVVDVVAPKTGQLLVQKGAKVTKKAAQLLRSHGVAEVHLDVAPAYEGIVGRVLGADVVDERTGEILAECFERLTTTHLRLFARANVRQITIIESAENEVNVMLATATKDKTASREEALLELFKRMRQGTPPSIQGAQRLFEDLFMNPRRYDLGIVGRYKLNKRFGLNVDKECRLLTQDDVVAIMAHLAKMAKEGAEEDDIDHLGTRRVRSVGELLQNQIRAALAELERTAREKMGQGAELENLNPQNLINAKPIIAALRDFFGRSPLSQFMDQVNPLSELTHKRRLSALGPGGLSRERAGFEVRDVHHTHYGRICPIETPEGPNIGLISSLSTYARINELGFIETPFRRVKGGRVTDEIVYMSADEEDEYVVAQANAPIDDKGHLIGELVLARKRGDFVEVPPQEVDFMDVSPKQLVSVSAALIPFLEHDDANRALMGSNMQRQAVPLLRTEAPIVGTGLEYRAAVDSGACVIARNDGVVERVTAYEIVVRNQFGQLDYYPLLKYRRSNQDTCINQKPIVSEGDEVKAGQVIADGPATDRGELALGANLLVAFMPFGGYNFEDAIVISERVVKDDVYTSVHIEEFTHDARETKTGKEEITRDIPNVADEKLAKLDENGLIIIGSEVKPGDYLVGKVTPRPEQERGPEDRLLAAIFGDKSHDVRDASLKAPAGCYGTVVDVKLFSRKERSARTDKQDKIEIDKVEREKNRLLEDLETQFTGELASLLAQIQKPILNYETGEVVLKPGHKVTEVAIEYVKRSLAVGGFIPVEGEVGNRVKVAYQKYFTRKQQIEEDARNRIDRIKAGEELPTGVLKTAKVYIAVKRKLQVGDKMAGRHGNKGVVAKIVPEEDMPFLADGRRVDIVLNPLGVPSRMNVGQILETHLGWAAQALGMKVASPVFDGAKEEEIRKLLIEARNKKLKESGDSRTFDELPDKEKMLDLNPTGQVTLFDGATGEPFDTPVTVGYIYMMKLAHLVDDKMHARATGPYSLVTQQPLGGKAQSGGQRFGEMEVWALEAYGAAYTLQEMLTVKSDDVVGRTKMYESIVQGRNYLQPGIPESFNVLVKELQGLCLNLELLCEEEDIPQTITRTIDEEILAQRREAGDLPPEEFDYASSYALEDEDFGEDEDDEL
ncbi:MAG: DNA-directed RNA polymerase subunit beta [Candidatus Sumerlaeaceae bacterium]|nr:DNA-directed RNA polymerase subunit beta [Candidatus Sumerlaeaceae bacterium]